MASFKVKVMVRSILSHSGDSMKRLMILVIVAILIAGCVNMTDNKPAGDAPVKVIDTKIIKAPESVDKPAWAVELENQTKGISPKNETVVKELMKKESPR
jgi:PBP1b-binding outer membrane lipoprotein LpoB